jgi:hypothetical protein
MPDLGELEIVERSLVIHEAKAGSRRLTKTLFLQLPDWNEVHGELILSDCSADIVAWVSYHWKECDDDKYAFDDVALGKHIHVLLSEDNKPYRGTVWKGPSQVSSIYINSWDSNAGEAIVAILARKKINGEELKTNTYSYTNSFHIKHNERRINFECDPEINADLKADIKNDHGGSDWLSRKAQEARGRLVEVAQLQETEEVLRAKIGEYIMAEDSYRAEIEQVWRLVTKETPQVFI